MVNANELVKALEAKKIATPTELGEYSNWGLDQAISLVRQMDEPVVDEDTVEQICQKLCSHFENLKRAEEDGGGELWYGELERIVKELRSAAPACWQPIETAPKGRSLLLYNDEIGRFIAEFSPWGKWENSNQVFTGIEAPTHWIPLPPAPKPEQTVNYDALELAVGVGELAYNDTEGDLRQAITEAVAMYADELAQRTSREEFEKWYMAENRMSSIAKTPTGLKQYPDNGDIYCKSETRLAWRTWRHVASIIKGDH